MRKIHVVLVCLLAVALSGCVRVSPEDFVAVVDGEEAVEDRVAMAADADKLLAETRAATPWLDWEDHSLFQRCTGDENGEFASTGGTVVCMTIMTVYVGYDEATDDIYRFDAAVTMLGWQPEEVDVLGSIYHGDEQHATPCGDTEERWRLIHDWVDSPLPTDPPVGTGPTHPNVLFVREGTLDHAAVRASLLARYHSVAVVELTTACTYAVG